MQLPRFQPVPLLCVAVILLGISNQMQSCGMKSLHNRVANLEALAVDTKTESPHIAAKTTPSPTGSTDQPHTVVKKPLDSKENYKVEKTFDIDGYNPSNGQGTKQTYSHRSGLTTETTRGSAGTRTKVYRSNP